MSDCSSSAMMPREGIRGRITWQDGTETELAFSRYVNGNERKAECVELDGERFVRVLECHDVNWRFPLAWFACSECGWADYVPNKCGYGYCPSCGRKVVER